MQTFLTTGQLPWWSAPLDRRALVDCWLQLTAETPHQLAAFLQIALQSAPTLQRVLYQFPEPVWLGILELLAPDWRSEVQAYLADMDRLIPHLPIWQSISPQRLRQTLWQGILLHVIRSSAPATPTHSAITIPAAIQENLLHLSVELKLNARVLIQQLQTAIALYNEDSHPLTSQLPAAISQFRPPDTSTMPPTSEAPSPLPSVTLSPNANTRNDVAHRHSLTHRPRPTLEVLNDLYIQNAGLVILGPFLPRFWTTLELLEANQFTGVEAAQRASLILQYLVDELLDTVESSLSLNKILCGLDPSVTLPAELVLTAAERSECAGLLGAIVQNWSILGSTSIAGLRTTFIERPGVLHRHHDGWLLQVEHQTHDILLDQLPWSIRVFKLPWMTEILHVEW